MDSSTKLPSGILNGNIVDLGMYDECVSVLKIINETEIQGRHCLYSFKTKMFPLSLTFSICLPSSCDAKDLNYIFDNINQEINETDKLRNWTIENFSATCSTIGGREISVGTIITM